MALVPACVALSGLTGFVAGYVYKNNQYYDCNFEVIDNPLQKIDKITQVAPRKDINNEIKNFDTRNLKKPLPVEKAITSQEDIIMHKLKEKLAANRQVIQSE